MEAELSSFVRLSAFNGTFNIVQFVQSKIVDLMPISSEEDSIESGRKEGKETFYDHGP